MVRELAIWYRLHLPAARAWLNRGAFRQATTSPGFAVFKPRARYQKGFARSLLGRGTARRSKQDPPEKRLVLRLK